MNRVNSYGDAAQIVYAQIKETVKQDAEGVTVRMGTITCPCGWERAIMHMFQCLYCKVWFCHNCAEQHFGKTVKQFKTEKSAQKES